MKAKAANKIEIDTDDVILRAATAWNRAAKRGGGGSLIRFMDRNRAGEGEPWGGSQRQAPPDLALHLDQVRYSTVDIDGPGSHLQREQKQVQSERIAMHGQAARPVPSPMMCDIALEELNGLHYVTWRESGALVGVFRVRNDGKLKALRRFPAELQS